MPQTLQAIAATVILGLLTLSAAQLSVREDRRQGRAEAELRALGAATSLLDRLVTLPFDDAGEVSSASELTPAASFGGGGIDPGAAGDLDDVHRATGTVTVSRDGTVLPFDVTASVRYVELVTAGGSVTFSSVSGPTYHKEVSVALAGPLGSNVQLSRVVTYAPPTP